jgi:hypothetical protein
MSVVAVLPPAAHRREPAPVDEAEARQVQEWADRLGVDRSELPRHGCPRRAGSCSQLLVADTAIPISASRPAN